MTLKINSMYEVSGGYLVPRSHLRLEKGERFAIFQELETTANGFISRHRTYSTRELRKKFKLEKGEKIDIL